MHERMSQSELELVNVSSDWSRIISSMTCVFAMARSWVLGAVAKSVQLAPATITVEVCTI